jgi:hypothetical protein
MELDGLHVGEEMFGAVTKHTLLNGNRDRGAYDQGE